MKALIEERRAEEVGMEKRRKDKEVEKGDRRVDIEACIVSEEADLQLRQDRQRVEDKRWQGEEKKKSLNMTRREFEKIRKK